MDISLETFKGKLQDAARPNRFAVQMIPGSIYSNGILEKEELYFHTKGLNLPGRSISEFEIKHLGLTRKMPGEPTYESLTVTFWNEYGWQLRTALEGWMDAIANMRTAIHSDSREIFAGTAHIYALGRTGEILADYYLHEFFPLQLGDIDLSHDSNDAVQEFTCSFSYSDWERKK